MKIGSSVEKIKYAISGAERITGKNLTLPILSSVLLIGSGRSLKIRATNLSLGVEIDIAAKVEKEGVVAVSGAILASFFNTFSKDDSVTFESNEKTLTITTSTTKAVMKCLPYDDFPTLPSVEGHELTMSSKKFIDGLKAVYFSAAYSEIKPELSSIYIYSKEDEIIFVATDSFRLAEKKIKIKNQSDFQSMLLPMKNALEIIKLFGDGDDEMKIMASKNQLAINTDGIYLTSRLVDGIFPDYKQIIPKNHSTEIIVLKQDLINALKISNLFSDKFNQVTFKVSPVNKKFEIDAKNMDLGETTTKLAGALKGESLEINCNQKYFTDAFQSINSDSISIECNEANKPVVIKGVSDQSFMYLVMPMNR